MAIEIERKYLVKDESWQAHADAGVFYSQGYISSDPRSSVRVRIAGQNAWLNIKSATTPIRRLEFEYPIPLHDAREMLEKLCADPPVEKVRYHVEYAGRVWEVDVFEGANAGLVIAEIELDDEQEPFESPPWLGDEVSHDPRYYNMNLARLPYSRW